jgi:hypothetical protein
MLMPAPDVERPDSYLVKYLRLRKRHGEAL